MSFVTISKTGRAINFIPVSIVVTHGATLRNMSQESSTRTTRLKGELDERYEEYRDQNDMTDSEAMRSLVRKGLDDSGREISNRFVKLTKSAIGAIVDAIAVLFVGVFVYSVYVSDGLIPTVILLTAIVSVTLFVDSAVDRIDARADEIDGSFSEGAKSYLFDRGNGDAT